MTAPNKIGTPHRKGTWGFFCCVWVRLSHSGCTTGLRFSGTGRTFLLATNQPTNQPTRNGWSVELTAFIRLMSRLRMSGGLLSLSLYAFMVWYLDNFTCLPLLWYMSGAMKFTWRLGILLNWKGGYMGDSLEESADVSLRSVSEPSRKWRVDAVAIDINELPVMWVACNKYIQLVEAF
jgi:hypothetical protein